LDELVPPPKKALDLDPTTFLPRNLNAATGILNQDKASVDEESEDPDVSEECE
jgi:hypothetical protein